MENDDDAHIKAGDFHPLRSREGLQAVDRCLHRVFLFPKPISNVGGVRVQLVRLGQHRQLVFVQVDDVTVEPQPAVLVQEVASDLRPNTTPRTRHDVAKQACVCSG